MVENQLIAQHPEKILQDLWIPGRLSGEPQAEDLPDKIVLHFCEDGIHSFKMAVKGLAVDAGFLCQFSDSDVLKGLFTHQLKQGTFDPGMGPFPALLPAVDRQTGLHAVASLCMSLNDRKGDCSVMSQKTENTFVDRIIDVVIHRRRMVEKVFAVLVLLSIVANFFIPINYDLTEYLPDWAPTMQGINRMEESFGYPGTARVMIDDVTMAQAGAYQRQLSEIEGVDSVSWLPGGNAYLPESFLTVGDISDYYKDNSAIMDVIFTYGDSDPRTYEAIDSMKELLGEKGHYSGPAIENKTLEESISREMPMIMAAGVVVIFAVLAITTTSWFEPVLFLLTMGLAIILNMGTNIIFGKISFLSHGIAAVIQLAVAMDYSIFLLHSFTAQKQKGLSDEEAMAAALHQAVDSIVSSGVTTIVGFVALALMRFTIGRDLGFVLAKGIVCSLATVLILMPALILRFQDRIRKTQHRSFVPSMDGFARKLFQGRKVLAVVVLLVIVPAYVAQNMIDFKYGTSAVGCSEGTQSYEDLQLMEERFGKSNMLLVLVPQSDPAVERAFTEELEQQPFVRSVTSLDGMLPEGVPESFLPEDLTSQLHNDGYSRIITTLRTESESDYAFQCTDAVRAIADKYYDESYFVGTTPATQDMKEIISSDYGIVNGISILGVVLVVYVTFRSGAMALTVIVPIEIAVFLNMAVPYLRGEELTFMGYLMVSSMQLGATVDYSILLTNNYLELRSQIEDKKKAAIAAISRSCVSILTSGGVLTLVGYALYFVSSISAIGDMGHLIGRGAIFSMILVLGFLPLLLTLVDKQIFKDQQRFEARSERLQKRIEEERIKRSSRLPAGSEE